MTGPNDRWADWALLASQHLLNPEFNCVISLRFHSIENLWTANSDAINQNGRSVEFWTDEVVDGQTGPPGWRVSIHLKWSIESHETNKLTIMGNSIIRLTGNEASQKTPRQDDGNKVPDTPNGTVSLSKGLIEADALMIEAAV